MTNREKEEDKSTWAIGGGVLLGVGVGFFYLSQSVFAFVGSILIGLALGLMVTAILSRIKKKWATFHSLLSICWPASDGWGWEKLSVAEKGASASMTTNGTLL